MDHSERRDVNNRKVCINIENYAREHTELQIPSENVFLKQRQCNLHRKWWLQTTHRYGSEQILFEGHVSSWVSSLCDAVYSSGVHHYHHNGSYLLRSEKKHMTNLAKIKAPNGPVNR